MASWPFQIYFLSWRQCHFGCDYRIQINYNLLQIYSRITHYMYKQFLCISISDSDDAQNSFTHCQLPTCRNCIPMLNSLRELQLVWRSAADWPRTRPSEWPCPQPETSTPNLVPDNWLQQYWTIAPGRGRASGPPSCKPSLQQMAAAEFPDAHTPCTRESRVHHVIFLDSPRKWTRVKYWVWNLYQEMPLLDSDNDRLSRHIAQLYQDFCNRHQDSLKFEQSKNVNPCYGHETGCSDSLSLDLI